MQLFQTKVPEIPGQKIENKPEQNNRIEEGKGRGKLSRNSTRQA